MNIYKISLYVAPEDIHNYLMPNQKEQIDNVIITSAQLCGDGYVHIKCVALEKEPSYMQNLMDNSSHIMAIEGERYITAIED